MAAAAPQRPARSRTSIPASKAIKKLKPQCPDELYTQPNQLIPLFERRAEPSRLSVMVTPTARARAAAKRPCPWPRPTRRKAAIGHRADRLRGPQGEPRRRRARAEVHRPRCSRPKGPALLLRSSRSFRGSHQTRRSSCRRMLGQSSCLYGGPLVPAHLLPRHGPRSRRRFPELVGAVGGAPRSRRVTGARAQTRGG